MKIAAIAFALLTATATAKTAPPKKQAAAGHDDAIRHLMEKVDQLSKDLSTEREARKELSAELRALKKAVPTEKKENLRRKLEEDLTGDEAEPVDEPNIIGLGLIAAKIAALGDALESIEKCVEYNDYYNVCKIGSDDYYTGLKLVSDDAIKMEARKDIHVKAEYGNLDMHAKGRIDLDSEYDVVDIDGYSGVNIDSEYGDIAIGAYGHLILHSEDSLKIKSDSSIYVSAGYGYYDHVKISAGGDVGLHSAYGDIYGVAKYGDIDWEAYYNVFLTADYGAAPFRLGSYHGKKIEKDEAIAANATFVGTDDTAEEDSDGGRRLQTDKKKTTFKKHY